MLELYTHPMSPCAQKVRIVLAEKNLAWVKHHVDLPNKENLRPEYLKLNPSGVVPTLVHDGLPIVESSIICEYLDDAFPEVKLAPADAGKKARMRLWMKHIDNALHPSCGALQWPLVMRPQIMLKTEDERQALLDRIPDKARRERQKRLVKLGLDALDVADAVRVYRKTIVDLEKVLRDQEWILGGAFSLADACMAPYFQTLLQFGWTALYTSDCPGVTAWFERCQARDSYKTSVAADFPDDVKADLFSRGKPAWEKIAGHLAAA